MRELCVPNNSINICVMKGMPFNLIYDYYLKKLMIYFQDQPSNLLCYYMQFMKKSAHCSLTFYLPQRQLGGTEQVHYQRTAGPASSY